MGMGNNEEGKLGLKLLMVLGYSSPVQLGSDTNGQIFNI